MFLCQDLAFFLAWARMKICNGSDYPEESLLRQGAMAAAHVNSQSLLNARHGLPKKTQGKCTQRMRQDSCEAHFLWKKTRSVGAADRITYKFTIALSARRTFIEKHMESGRVSATHVFLEKRYGIRERLAASHINLQSH